MSVATLFFDVSTYQSGIRHAPHQHDELQLSIILRGRVRETVGSSTELAGPLSVVAKDSGVVHSDDFGPETPRIARLSLRSGMLASLLDDPSRAESWRWTHDPRVANPFLRLIERAYADGARTFDSTDPDVIDLLALFTARIDTARAAPPSWLAQVVEEIRSSWHPDLTVRDVARKAGVHPVYLARCVRRWYGTGVAEEMRKARVRAAAAALASTRESVSTVAHRHGYSDEAHLCRELRSSLSLTPRRYRSLVRNFT
jgi:AraC family transcriptional regulator